MTLLDAKQYDPTRDRRWRTWIIAIIIAVIVLGWLAYHFRYYSQRHEVGQFFAALQSQDYSKAFAIWNQDPNWKQHPEKYKEYSYNDFYRDWGLGGQWGVIKSYSVNCSVSPGNGVIVQVTVNHRLEHAFVWVDKSDKTLSFSPNDIDCGNWFGWLTE